MSNSRITQSVRLRREAGRSTKFLVLAVLCGASLTSCMAVKPLPPAETIVAPTPIEGTTGKYMCPYTSDGTVAEWVSTALTSSAASSISSAAGGYLLSRFMPFGGLFGAVIGKKVGKEVAIKAAGGWEAIKASSDLSFDSAEAMAVYVYAKHSKHADFQQVVDATAKIYEDFAAAYPSAIHAAARQQVAVGTSTRGE